MPAMPADPFRLPVRQYIAVPSGEPRGLVTETWELPVARTAFIELHCWNVGVPGGLPVPDEYWVFMGSKQNHVRMARVVEGVIVPAMAAARRGGVPPVHVQPESVAARNPQLRPPPRQARDDGDGVLIAHRPAAVLASDHAGRRANRVHGEGYMAWEGWERLDVAPQLRPQSPDVMIAATEEFHSWLQERHITTLVYTGFCANLCILDSPAAMKPMAALGYRCVLLREGTLGIEFADQPPDMHTEAALRYVEAWVGYTASAADWMAALG
jgi:nicotinamidase-related amidase